MADLKIVVDQLVKNPQAIKQVTQDVKELGRAGADSEAGIGRAEKATGLLGSAVGKLAAGGVLLAVGKGMLDFGKQSIAAASEVEEAASKFGNVFGPEAERVGGALDSFAEAAGRSRYEMRSMAGDLGALLVPMVGNTEAAGDMSVELAKLATDLSSFFNVAESDALTALRAGLVGETEPMRQFGVNISAAAVEANILAKGIANTKGEITDAMKVQERFNMILEGTALAHNDAIETADSYANQQRNMQAAIQDLQVAIGTGLLPVMTDLVSQVAEVADRLIPAAEAMSGSYGAAVQEMTDKSIEAAKTQEQLATEAMKMADALTLAKTPMGQLTGTSDELQGNLKEVLASMLDVSSGADTMAQRGRSVEEQLKAIFGAAVEVDRGMVKLNGETVVSADVLYQMAEAQATAEEKANLLRAGIEGSADAFRDYATAAQGVLPPIATFEESVRNTTRLLAQYGDGLHEDTRAMEDAAYATGELGNTQERLDGYIEDATEAAKAQEEATEAAAKAAEEAAKFQAEYNRTMGEYFIAAAEGGRMTAFFNESIDELGTHFVRVGGLTAEQNTEVAHLNEEMERLQDVYDKAAQTVADYGLGIKGVGQTEEQRTAELEEQNAVMAAAQAGINNITAALGPYNEVQGELVQRTVEATINQEALNQSIFDSLVAQGANAEQLAIAGAALGIYTEQQAQAALMTALIQEKIHQLTAEFIENGGSIQGVQMELNNFIAGLNEVPAASSTATAAIVDTRLEAQALADGSPYTATVEADTSAAEAALAHLQDLMAGIAAGGVGVDITVGGGGRQHGGPVMAGIPYTVGEAGAETFVPSTNGYIVPNGGGNTNITVNVYGGGDDIAAKVTGGVISAARQIGLTV